MNNKNVTITVGISAYNEEKTIKRVIEAVLKQKAEGWLLKEILITCDGCNDQTAEKARQVKSKLVNVIDDGKRLGKALRMGQIFKQAEGEFILMLDADIEIKSNQVISNLVKPFKNEDVALVGGNTRPKKPITFFEKAVYSTFLVFDESRKKMNNGHNIFGCTGACMMMRKSFAKSLKFPKVMNEDDFIYFSCLKQKRKFVHVSDSVVYYRLPTKLSDYLKQVFRSNPEAVRVSLNKRFKGLVEKEYRRPLNFYFNTIIKVLFQYPVPTLYIVFINSLCRPFFSLISKNYKLTWFTATSTKN